nr:hypothetical protein CFP56_20511 [Quercus suber]
MAATGTTAIALQLTTAQVTKVSRRSFLRSYQFDAVLVESLSRTIHRSSKWSFILMISMPRHALRVSSSGRLLFCHKPRILWSPLLLTVLNLTPA